MYRYDCRVVDYVLSALDKTDLSDFDRLLGSIEPTVEKYQFTKCLIHSMRTAFVEHFNRQIELGKEGEPLTEVEYEDVQGLSQAELTKAYTECLEIITKELSLIPKSEKKKKGSPSKSTEKQPSKI